MKRFRYDQRSEIRSPRAPGAAARTGRIGMARNLAGVAVVEISKADARILSMVHYK